MEEATVIENTYAPRRTREEALEAARRSTVTVRRAAGYGSGFAIGDGALVLTNAHVVGNADRVALVTASGLELDAEVVARDTGRDVALLRVGSGVRLPPLYIDDDLPSAGATVFAVGSPLTESLSGTVTSGIVSGTRLLDGVNWIQSDVAVSPGNSGGPVLNEQGAVVAISTAGFQAGGSQVGLNLLIPIREALAYLELRLPVESQRD
jgi:S1-C subfamily serine protease